METRIDSTGRELPAIELPTPDRLRVYGDMLFLAFRSQRHAGMTTAALRAWFEPPVELGQFRIFRFDDVPRGMYTWARLDCAAERKMIEGGTLTPEEWRSGGRLWIIDMIAPYRGLTASISRWVMQRGNFTRDEFLFRRVKDANTTRRIVHVDFHADRLARILDEKTFLKEICQKETV
jgi:cytolysin-activating lysine-acyltransferase